MNLAWSNALSQHRQLKSKLSVLLPGLLICLVVAMSAQFVSEHYGGPAILYALLLGMAFNHLAVEGRCVAGIQVSAKSVLRFGIALLGARITIEQLAELGIIPIVIVVLGIPLTIVFGWLTGRLLGLGNSQSILTGSAVGICGASAALAVASVLPQNKETEKHLIFTVIGVTALSTLAMIVYPLLVNWLAFTPQQSGIFLGATIHDVAQVVGAGYMISNEVGDVATFTKLLRVAGLVPVVVVLSVLVSRSGQGKNRVSQAPLPGFLVAFVVVVILNSMGWISSELQSGMTELSRWCLLVAMVGLGMKASFKELSSLGWRPAVLMVAETVFLALLAVLLLVCM